MSKERRSNREGKKKAAMTMKEKKAQKKSKKDAKYTTIFDKKQ